MTTPANVARAVADAHRAEWGRVVAATVRVVADLDLAEDSVQDAYAAALVAWARDGIPSSPVSWLITTARHRAVDVVRREVRLHAKLPLLREEPDGPGIYEPLQYAREEDTPDERWRLIFRCCHPARAPEAQMALTLRLVCGMSTAAIARAFLVSESTMAARLTRAKRKIKASRIPMWVPTVTELPDRVRTVLATLYALCTMGQTAPSGATLMRPDLVDQAFQVARNLHELLAEEAETGGLLAWLLVTHARRAARVDAHGQLVKFSNQDRALWNRTSIAAAQTLLDESRRRAKPGRLPHPGITVSELPPA